MLKSEYLTPHFLREEMECPCCRVCEMDNEFMQLLEKLRNKLAHALVINSGYRCQPYNDSLKNSSPRSWHIKGKAADISWDEFTGEQKSKMLYQAMGMFDGIGISRSFLHVDKGGKTKIWTY